MEKIWVTNITFQIRLRNIQRGKIPAHLTSVSSNKFIFGKCSCICMAEVFDCCGLPTFITFLVLQNKILIIQTRCYQPSVINWLNNSPSTWRDSDPAFKPVISWHLFDVTFHVSMLLCRLHFKHYHHPPECWFTLCMMKVWIMVNRLWNENYNSVSAQSAAHAPWDISLRKIIQNICFYRQTQKGLEHKAMLA